MFFKKRREAKKAAAEEAKQKVIRRFDQELQNAEKIPDIAERFLRLEEVRESIDAQIDTTQKEIAVTARGKYGPAYMGVAGGTALGAGILVLGLHAPPVLLLLVYPGIFGGTKTGVNAIAKAMKQLTEENQPFFDRLSETKGRAVEKADAILALDLDTLAKSKKFEEIVEKVPRVRDHFTAAFARRITKDDDRAVPPPKPPGNNGGLQL